MRAVFEGSGRRLMEELRHLSHTIVVIELRQRDGRMAVTLDMRRMGRLLSLDEAAGLADLVAYSMAYEFEDVVSHLVDGVNAIRRGGCPGSLIEGRRARPAHSHNKADAYTRSMMVAVPMPPPMPPWPLLARQ